jgi:hypothetical protein
MQIAHLSVAVAKPERAARAVAEIWRGSAFPFFPYPGAWIAFSGDEPSSQLEFYPDGTELAPHDSIDDYEFRHTDAARPLTPTHIAIKTPNPRDVVEHVTQREAWRCRPGNRGGAFDTLDVWIENRLLLEVLTPELQPAFDRAMNPDRWRVLAQTNTG